MNADAEAEAPIFWPSDVKNWFIGKDPDAGKDWRQEEKEMKEDESRAGGPSLENSQEAQKCEKARQ